MGGALILVGALAFLDGTDDDEVALPPVQQIRLTTAARLARCDLRDGDRWDILGLPLAASEP